MTVNGTTRGIARKGGFAGIAVAVGLAAMSLAAPAAAGQLIILNSATMDTTYRANIAGVGQAYSNGVTFNASTVVNPDVDFEIYGFCVDIFHHMYINTPLGYTYYSNKDDPGEPLTTNFDGGTLTTGQKDHISALVDIGYLLHRDHFGPGEAADTSMQTAAIQAAIWEAINPSAVTVYTGNLSVADGEKYTDYFEYYRDTVFTGPRDRIYTITDTATNPSHQAFAVGWPVEGVPEPGAWALMLVGFLGLGGAIRRQRRIAAAA